MKITNAQLRAVLPPLVREQKVNPDVDLGAFIENLVVLAIARNERDLLRGLNLDRSEVAQPYPEGRGKMDIHPKPVHPLLGG